MEKMTEVFIRKLLKGWVNQYTPPQNGRARLLWEASRQSRLQKQPSISHLVEYKECPAPQANEWSHTLFRWILENGQHTGIQARVC
jgi:hypothetical protein